MRIKLARGTFVRYCGDECVVWCPRTGGCSILRSANVIVKAIGRDAISVEAVAKYTSKALDCSVQEARDAVEFVLKEMGRQHFVEVEMDGNEQNDYGDKQELPLEREDDDSYTPIADFFRKYKIPQELHIDLTNACNERCVHCYHPSHALRHLSLEIVFKLLDEFRAIQGVTVHLTGGECMLHPDFRKICERCVRLNINMIVMTNLTNCDSDMIRFLKHVDPQFLNVSLYSMKADEHDAITGIRGSWHRTMDAILACEKAGVHIRIATPLLRINRNAFADLKRFTQEHHMHLIPSAEIVAKSNHDCDNLVYACSPQEFCEVACKDKELFDDGWGAERCAGDKVCSIGLSRLYVNSKGDYYPCDSMHEYVLGNVATHTLEAVWRGEKLEYLRGLKNRDFGKCATCKDRPWCKLCPAANFNATGDMFKIPPGRCEMARVVHKVYGKDR